MNPWSINRFEGEYRFLSNFFIEPDGTTVEHEFQADKTLVEDERKWILSQPTPGKAKRAGSKRGLNGRKITLREDWEEIKVERMRHWVRRKFMDHRDIRIKLLDTSGLVLIEGNDWHDTFWGICDGTCRSGPHKPFGDNNLGIALMDIRRFCSNTINGGR